MLFCTGDWLYQRMVSCVQGLSFGLLMQDPAMTSLGDGHLDGHGAPGGRLGSPYQKSQASELAGPGYPEQDGFRKANSHDSDALIHMVSP